MEKRLLEMRVCFGVLAFGFAVLLYAFDHVNDRVTAIESVLHVGETDGISDLGIARSDELLYGVRLSDVEDTRMLLVNGKKALRIRLPGAAGTGPELELVHGDARILLGFSDDGAPAVLAYDANGLLWRIPAD